MTLTTLALAASAAGTAAAVAGQVQAGKTARAAGDAANEAAMTRSKQMFDEGRERSSRMRDDNARRMAAIRSRMAGSGTTIGGSGLDFIGAAAGRLETRVQDAFRQSSIGAENELYGGNLARWEGKQQQTASQLRGFGTLLEGVGSFYNQGVKSNAWNSYKART